MSKTASANRAAFIQRGEHLGTANRRAVSMRASGLMSNTPATGSLKRL